MSNRRPHVVVTGGAGYVGSHCVVEFADAGWDVTVADDLSRGHLQAVERAAELSSGSVEFVHTDITEPPQLDRLFAKRPVDAVAHFAAFKSVPESVERPAMYYRTNVGGTAALCEAMRSHGVRRLVFSSSAAVYGSPESLPASEVAPRRPLSPYGDTKAVGEDLIEATASAEGWSVVLLRYFNPVGAHPSGRIGEDGEGATNLVPVVLDAALGHRPPVVICGLDYPTSDGSPIRDYVHIMDVASAHSVAIDATAGAPGTRLFNIGTGRGASVLEVLSAVADVIGRPVPSVDGPRRAGDMAELVADVSRIRDELSWSSSRSLHEMVEDAWRWRTANPDGYRK